MAQITDRIYHYKFTHIIIRDLFYKDPKDFIEILGWDGEDLLIELITLIAEEYSELDFLNTDEIEFELVDFADNCEFALIKLPTPVVQTEALYVGALIILNKNAGRNKEEFINLFYTFELTKPNEYVLCKWTISGMHINTMKRTNNPTKQEFIKMVKMDISNYNQ